MACPLGNFPPCRSLHLVECFRVFFNSEYVGGCTTLNHSYAETVWGLINSTTQYNVPVFVGQFDHPANGSYAVHSFRTTAGFNGVLDIALGTPFSFVTDWQGIVAGIIAALLGCSLVLVLLMSLCVQIITRPFRRLADRVSQSLEVLLKSDTFLAPAQLVSLPEPGAFCYVEVAQTMEALRQIAVRQNLMRAVVDAICFPILLLVPTEEANTQPLIHWEIAYVNHCFTTTFGYRPVEVPPLCVLLNARAPHRHHRGVRGAGAGLGASGGASPPEIVSGSRIVLRTAAGEPIHVVLRVVEINAVMKFLLLEDISRLVAESTERLHLERQILLVQRIQCLGRLARGFSVELNNCLGGISTSLELARAEVVSLRVAASPQLNPVPPPAAPEEPQSPATITAPTPPDASTALTAGTIHAVEKPGAPSLLQLLDDILAMVGRVSETVSKLAIFGQGNVHRMAATDVHRCIAEAAADIGSARPGILVTTSLNATESMVQPLPLLFSYLWMFGCLGLCLRSDGAGAQSASAPRLRFSSSSWTDRQYDPALLRNAVANLIVNGCDAMEGKGGTLSVVTINATLPEGSVPKGLLLVVAVTDQGRGISQANLQRIFEPFFTTKQRGNGLGLPVVFGMVQDLGGRIEVWTGHWGTRFVILLPLQQPAPTPGSGGGPVPTGTPAAPSMLCVNSHITDTPPPLMAFDRPSGGSGDGNGSHGGGGGGGGVGAQLPLSSVSSGSPMTTDSELTQTDATPRPASDAARGEREDVLLLGCPAAEVTRVEVAVSSLGHRTHFIMDDVAALDEIARLQPRSFGHILLSPRATLHCSADFPGFLTTLATASPLSKVVVVTDARTPSYTGELPKGVDIVSADRLTSCFGPGSPSLRPNTPALSSIPSEATLTPRSSLPSDGGLAVAAEPGMLPFPHFTSSPALPTAARALPPPIVSPTNSLALSTVPPGVATPRDLELSSVSPTPHKSATPPRGETKLPTCSLHLRTVLVVVGAACVLIALATGIALFLTAYSSIYGHLVQAEQNTIPKFLAATINVNRYDPLLAVTSVAQTLNSIKYSRLNNPVMVEWTRLAISPRSPSVPHLAALGLYQNGALFHTVAYGQDRITLCNLTSANNTSRCTHLLYAEPPRLFTTPAILAPDARPVDMDRVLPALDRPQCTLAEPNPCQGTLPGCPSRLIQCRALSTLSDTLRGMVIASFPLNTTAFFPRNFSLPLPAHTHAFMYDDQLRPVDTGTIPTSDQLVVQIEELLKADINATAYPEVYDLEGMAHSLGITSTRAWGLLFWMVLAFPVYPLLANFFSPSNIVASSVIGSMVVVILGLLWFLLSWITRDFTALPTRVRETLDQQISLLGTISGRASPGAIVGPMPQPPSPGDDADSSVDSAAVAASRAARRWSIFQELDSIYRALNNVRTNPSLLRSLIEAIPMPTLVFRIVHAPRKPRLARHWASFTPPGPPRELEDPSHPRGILHRADGTELPVALHVLNIEQQYLIVIFEDLSPITSEHEACVALSQQLHELQQAESTGRFAGGAAHDINNVLTGIILSTELLQGRLQDENLDAALPAIGDVLALAHRASETVAKLLMFSRRAPRSGTGVADAHQCVGAVSDLLRHSLDPRIVLNTSLLATEYTVEYDLTLLRNALLNLAVNARDAMPNGGELLFATANATLPLPLPNSSGSCDSSLVVGDAPLPAGAAPGRYLVLAVSDTGTGIAPAAQPHLFEPFTTKTGAAGLGLAAVFGMLQDVGGWVDVTTGPWGSRFALWLPLESPRNPAQSVGLSGTPAAEATAPPVLPRPQPPSEDHAPTRAAPLALIPSDRHSLVRLVTVPAPPTPACTPAPAAPRIHHHHGHRSHSHATRRSPHGGTPAGAAAPRFPFRVLLVDDDRVIQLAGAQILRSLGAEAVVVVGDGQAALEAVAAAQRPEERPFDLVLLDLGLPLMAGPEAFARMREVAPDLVVVVLSGDAAGPEGDALLAAGAPLQKPFGAAELEGVIEQLQSLIVQRPAFQKAHPPESSPAVAVHGAVTAEPRVAPTSDRESDGHASQSPPPSGIGGNSLAPSGHRHHRRSRPKSHSASKLAPCILLVDDDEVVRQAAEKMLVHLGYRVLSACDGLEGVEQFQAHMEDVALVMLDIVMPRMGLLAPVPLCPDPGRGCCSHHRVLVAFSSDGREAFFEMKRLCPAVRVLIASGFPEGADVEELTRAGARFLQKPYPLKVLRDILKGILADGQGRGDCGGAPSPSPRTAPPTPSSIPGPQQQSE
ncbi:putative PAS domain S-box protein [Paratrimastix pyriformis]|uniref:PAS domain S-box protein n=1 Tax=Paratrimastix pyriformis TaxID=342808 RepID=A0ABQ8UG91_9EUKA|nr:putative PAS domain S-box protein [Paratrimastix pyriformis]